MSDDSFDVIIVGGGIAGISSALVCARAGLSTVLIERGEFCGSKNLSGGVLFSPVINNLIPNFWEHAPVERPVTSKRFGFLTKEQSVVFDYSSRSYTEPPFNNNFTVLRAKFDKWYAEQAEAAGAEIYTGFVVDDVIKSDTGQVIGVKVRSEDGYEEFNSHCVIIAEGANSFLPERMGLRQPYSPDQMVTCAKEIVYLNSERIEDRFNLEPGEGASLEFLGFPGRNIIGGGFLYTNKSSISIGVGVMVNDAMREQITPYNLLDEFKSHPSVRNYIANGKVEEYSAHLIPEGGYNHMPTLFGDGFLVAGDAAGFVNNSLYHEGTNFASESGRLAAETIIKAKTNNDFSRTTLSGYKTMLDESFVMKDLHRYRQVGQFIRSHPEFLSTYPDTFLKMFESYFKVSDQPKREGLQKMVDIFKDRISIIKFVLDSAQAVEKIGGVNPVSFLTGKVK